MELFKRKRKTANENSWVIIAKRNFQNLIWSLRALDTIFESLILAQDERWRRA